MKIALIFSILVMFFLSDVSQTTPVAALKSDGIFQNIGDNQDHTVETPITVKSPIQSGVSQTTPFAGLKSDDIFQNIGDNQTHTFESPITVESPIQVDVSQNDTDDELDSDFELGLPYKLFWTMRKSNLSHGNAGLKLAISVSLNTFDEID
uniref:Uncharacterized protein n=1 Tax=Arion vulgaris TaxID=1028688 RepID=A0A0B6YTB3_9EUPU